MSMNDFPPYLDLPKPEREKLFYIETSLPGDEGKYFRYTVFTEDTLEKYRDWFQTFDEYNHDTITYYTNREYIYRKEELLHDLWFDIKPITREETELLKKFAPGTRFDVFQRIINQHIDVPAPVDDDDPANEWDNLHAIGQR